MRCTTCNEVIKPVVAIDIDGTLGDYHTHLIDFMRAYLGKTEPWYDVHGYGYDCSIKMSEWANRVYGITHSEYEAIKLAYRQGAQKRSMPPYPGIDSVCREIRELGAELWVTTTRPFLRLDGVDPDTRFWLEQNYVKYDGLLYDEDKYRLLAERIDPSRVVAVLDDLPEQYDAAAEMFGSQVPILRMNKYNRAVTRPQQAINLDAAGIMIKQALRNWELEDAVV